MSLLRRVATAAPALLLPVILLGQEREEVPPPAEPPVVAPELRLGRLDPKPPSLFDPTADPVKDIAEGVARSRKEGRRVLVLWGADWCSWSRGLDQLLLQSPRLRAEAAAEYEIVRVDVGRYDRNSDLLASYDVDLERTRIPVLSVLDDQGGLLFSGESGFLESRIGREKGFDVQKVHEFLAAYRTPPKSADDAFASALAAAAAAKRSLFVHFEVPLSVSCRALEDWLARPEVRSLLQKDFVVLKIDLQRMTGGDRLLAGLRDASSKELPWMAVFDSSGKLVATSDVDADGCRNIQFPQSDADIAHFGWMLAQGSLRLFAPDIQKLEDSLRAERERRSKRSKTGPTEVRPGDARPGGARPDGGADTDGSGG